MKVKVKHSYYKESRDEKLSSLIERKLCNNPYCDGGQLESLESEVRNLRELVSILTECLVEQNLLPLKQLPYQYYCDIVE